MPEPPDLERFDPLDPVVQQCPFPYYRAMQQTGAVVTVPGSPLAFVTRHESMAPVLRDTATFSSRFVPSGPAPRGPLGDELAEIRRSGWPAVPTMLTVDPPEHGRYRATVASFFSPRRVEGLRPLVSAIADRLAEDLVTRARAAPGGVIDVVAAFAVPLPVQVIAAVLDVPPDRVRDLKRWSDDSIVGIGAAPPAERRLDAERGVVEMQQYFAARFEERRAGAPCDDLLGTLAAAHIEDLTAADGARALRMDELLSIVQQLLVAGNETTTKALAEGLRLLAQEPQWWDWLREDPPARVAALVEEVLRLSSPTQGMFRITRTDATVDGTPVAKGTVAVLVYAAANRDPAVFADPDRFDPTRPALKEHLAFGKGAHFCLGAPLARLELQVALVALARRVARFSCPPDTTFAYEPSFVLRGLTRLDLAATVAADRIPDPTDTHAAPRPEDAATRQEDERGR